MWAAASPPTFEISRVSSAKLLPTRTDRADRRAVGPLSMAHPCRDGKAVEHRECGTKERALEAAAVRD